MKSFFKKIVISILKWEARLVLKKYKPYIVAVTGSVGKTSTKDALYTVFSSSLHIRRSEKSFNSEFGLPLTILGCHSGWNDPFLWLKNIFEGLELILLNSEYPKCLILEVGADHPGDIESVSKWLQTDIAIITKVGDVPVHVEFFASPEDVLKEKAFLIQSLKKEGTLILSADDVRVRSLSAGVEQKCLTFGMTGTATVTASDMKTVYDESFAPKGISFVLRHQGDTVLIELPGVLGIQHIYPVIAAATAGIAYGMALPAIAQAFEHHVPPRGRMNVIKGIKGSTLIDDTYNSSPDALHEGLATLASLQVSGKRIAVLGDMMELGSFSGEEHRKAGIQALQSSDMLITVGPRAQKMSDKATSFASSDEAGDYLTGIVGQGDVVFIKGSQSIRMERITKALLADPSQAENLLVRQEPEWLAKK